MWKTALLSTFVFLNATAALAATPVTGTSAAHPPTVKANHGKTLHKKKRSPGSEYVEATRDWTVRIGSVAAGTMVGLPIAAVRVMKLANEQQAKSLPFVGERESGARVWIARGIVAPASVFSGIVIAPFCSAVDAWKGSSDQPFSKDCFSLGELDEGVVAF